MAESSLIPPCGFQSHHIQTIMAGTIFDSHQPPDNEEGKASLTTYTDATAPSFEVLLFDQSSVVRSGPQEVNSFIAPHEVQSRNVPNYNTTNHHEVYYLSKSPFDALPGYAETGHVLEKDSTISLHELTNDYPNTTHLNNDGYIQTSLSGTSTSSPSLEASTTIAHLQCSATEMNFAVSNYSNVVHESQACKEQITIVSMTLPPVETSSILAGVYANTNAASTVDSTQAHAGSAGDSNHGYTAQPLTTTHKMGRPQLEAWMRQTADKDMTMTEMLEKKKIAWAACH